VGEIRTLRGLRIKTIVAPLAGEIACGDEICSAGEIHLWWVMETYDRNAHTLAIELTFGSLTLASKYF